MDNICTVCGFDFQPLIDEFGEVSVSTMPCPNCQLTEHVLVDDMLTLSIPTIAVGSRVKHVDQEGLGTIIYIDLRPDPFRVQWDDGDWTDWYTGNSLVLVKE